MDMRIRVIYWEKDAPEVRRIRLAVLPYLTLVSFLKLNSKKKPRTRSANIPPQSSVKWIDERRKRKKETFSHIARYGYQKGTIKVLKFRGISVPSR